MTTPKKANDDEVAMYKATVGLINTYEGKIDNGRLLGVLFTAAVGKGLESGFSGLRMIKALVELVLAMTQMDNNDKDTPDGE